MGTLTMKFGGTALGTSAALSQVLSIVLHEKQHWNHLLLVASALDGVTDNLLEAAQLAQLSNPRGYRRIAANLRTRHLALVDSLQLSSTERTNLQADIDRLLFELLDTCQTVADTPSEQLPMTASDAIVAVGERLAARIVAAMLRSNGLRGVALDATDLIITDDTHGNALPDLKQTAQRVQANLLPLFESGIVPVVTGYIGATSAGATTTLGRGGSDYTAAVLSVLVKAREVWMWSDVDGMMSSDPREVNDAQVIDELTYNEVAELAYFGARIIHARMIAPLREKQIPLRIKNVYQPQRPGTLIRQAFTYHEPRLKAVTTIQGIGLTANRSGSLVTITELVDQTLFDEIGVRADVVFTAQSSSRSFLCVIVPVFAQPESMQHLQAALLDQLEAMPTEVEWTVQPMTVVTAIGENLDQSTTVTATILQALQGVRLSGITQGPSNCSLSVIVAPHDADEALQRVHRLALSSASSNGSVPRA